MNLSHSSREKGGSLWENEGRRKGGYFVIFLCAPGPELLSKRFEH